jgi:hypothetical protein
MPVDQMLVLFTARHVHPPQMARELLDDCQRYLILNGEDVLQSSIVDFREEVVSVPGADELRGHAHLIAGLADTALEDVRDPQLFGDASDVLVVVLERERGGSSRDPQPVHPRERVDDLLGNAVAEELVLGIRAHVDERQDRDAPAGARAAGPHGRLVGRDHSVVDDGVHLHRTLDVLQVELSQSTGPDVGLVLHLVVDLPGDEHRTRNAKALDPGGDVHAVAEHPVLVVDHIPCVDTDAERNGWIGGAQGGLNLDRAMHRPDRALEHAECSVPVELQNPPTVLGDRRLQDLSVPVTVGHRLMLVLLHQCGVPDHVGEHDGGELPDHV